MTESKNKNRKVLTILDFIIVIAKRKVLIIGSLLLSIILFTIFTILSITLPYDNEWNYFPDKYMSLARIMITWEEMALVQKITGATDAYSKITPAVGGGINPFFEMVYTLITGNTVLDNLSEELGLYEKISPSKSYCRWWLLQRIIIYPVTSTPLPNFLMIQVGIQHEDKKGALKILNLLIYYLQEKFRELAMEQITIRKEYILERMGKAESEINKIKDEILNFQTTYGIYDINKQLNYQSNLIAENTIEIMRKELEIQLLKQYLNSNDPKIRILEDEIDTRKSFINKLNSSQIRGFVSIETLEDAKIMYSQLEQNLNIQTSIYQNLLKEYEIIKVEETGALSNFIIVEDGELAEGKFAPIREFQFIIIFLFVLVLSVLWACIKEYFAKLIKKPGEDKKYEEIKSHFKIKKK